MVSVLNALPVENRSSENSITNLHLKSEMNEFNQLIVWDLDPLDSRFLQAKLGGPRLSIAQAHAWLHKKLEPSLSINKYYDDAHLFGLLLLW